jgi:hypothetical protein
MTAPVVDRRRVVALVVICVLAVVGAGGYLAYARSTKPKASTAPPPTTTDLATLLSQPHIVFRNTTIGPDYGFISVVSLANPAGPRATIRTACDRVYANGSETLCLSSDRGIATTYKAQVFDAAMKPIRSLPLSGIPSRARLSADGTMAATTSFVAGDSYASSNFSTRTIISSVANKFPDVNLESFSLRHDGATIRPVDRNFWGVTFAADDNTFYATVAFNGKTYLARGDLKAHTITTMNTDAECPSLSPDGKTVVYKKRGDRPAGQWRLASLDIATGKETMLAETTNVDDQVEWLDNSHVLYGIPRAGSSAAEDDVQSVAIDGSGAAKLVIPQAWSPAVVRPG